MLLRLAVCLTLLLAWPPQGAAQIGAADPSLGARTALVPKAPAIPTIDDFLAKPSTVDVALAPGGRYVAAVRQQDGVTFLTVRDLKDPDAKLTAMKLGKTQVSALKWLNDERLIYSAGSMGVAFFSRGGRALFSFNIAPVLYAVDRDLKNNIAFFQNDKAIEARNVIFSSDITPIPGDAMHFLVPARVGRNLDLVRVNAIDGKWTIAAKGAEYTMAWFVDRAAQPAIRFDTNRRMTEVRVMTPEIRGDSQARWKQALKVRLDRDTARSPDFTPIAPGPTPNLYYVLGRPAGSDRAGIHLYDVNTQLYTKEVFTPLKADVASGVIDPATGDYIGASYWNDKLEMTFLDKRMQAHFNGLDVFFGHERSISFIDSSADHTVWILATSGPRDPGSYHVYDMSAAKNEFIGARNPRLQESQLGKSQAVAYQARDGLDITGYLTLPPNLPEGAKPPLIVYPHGGPEARDLQDFDLIAQFLATRGYAVFQPNFRGSSGFGKAFAEAGRRQFGKAMQSDIVDGVNHVAGLGLVDANRICIMGASYGGYAALMGVIQNPGLYQCAVSASGLSDLYRQIRWERDEEGSDSEAYKYWVEQIGDPKRDKAELEGDSPINHVASINVPVLLVHGKLDDTVPIEQSARMHAAMQKAGKASTFIQFERAGHGFEDSDLESYLKQLESFFGQHLPISTAPPG